MAIGTAGSSSTWRSATSSIPTSASCAASTCAAASVRPGSARGRSATGSSGDPSIPGTASYIEGDDWRLQTREIDGEFALELHNGDRFVTGYTDIYEFLPRPFVISTSPRVVLPVGDYDFGNFRVGYNFGQQRFAAANLLAEQGTFYDGHARHSR